jgi:hypothetical protein
VFLHPVGLRFKRQIFQGSEELFPYKWGPSGIYRQQSPETKTLAIGLQLVPAYAPFDIFKSERTRNMRKVLTLCGLVAVFCTLALADNFTGKLLDSACYDQSKTAKGCDATSSTSAFLLDVSGKVYKLDSAGNAKAAEAMKSHAERSSNPNRPTAGAVNAKVSGAKDGDDTIKVEMIEIQ